MKGGKDYRKVKKCRYCNSSKLTLYLSLGNQPLANSFIKPKDISSEKKYPLTVTLCRSCYLSQLGYIVSAETIFTEYLYLSSTSQALVNHYQNLGKYLTKKLSLQKGDVFVDIGCNDGILLKGFGKNIQRIGVEPSQVADIAKKTGFVVYKEYFTPKTAKKIVRKYGKAKLATATNVFAHVDDIHAFVSALPILLDEDGVFVIEAPYLLDMVDKILFDTIYHEHLAYISLTPLIPFFEKFNLEVFDIEHIDLGASGPALRIFVGKKEKRKIEKSVVTMIKREEVWGIKKVGTYRKFAKRIKTVKKDLWKKMKKIKSTGAHLAGFGAPAKGNTLLNYFHITKETVEYIAETNPLKQHMLTPGSHISIISNEDFIKKMPEYALLLSWNYLDFLLQNHPYIKMGGKFLVPLPHPTIKP